MSIDAIGTDVGQLRQRYVRALDHVERASERAITALVDTRDPRPSHATWSRAGVHSVISNG